MTRPKTPFTKYIQPQTRNYGAQAALHEAFERAQNNERVFELKCAGHCCADCDYSNKRLFTTYCTIKRNKQVKVYNVCHLWKNDILFPSNRGA